MSPHPSKSNSIGAIFLQALDATFSDSAYSTKELYGLITQLGTQYTQQSREQLGTLQDASLFINYALQNVIDIMPTTTKTDLHALDRMWHANSKPEMSIKEAVTVVRQHTNDQHNAWYASFMSILPKYKICNATSTQHTSITFVSYSEFTLQPSSTRTSRQQPCCTSAVSAVHNLQMHEKDTNHVVLLVLSDVVNKITLWLSSVPPIITKSVKGKPEGRIDFPESAMHNSKYAIVPKHRNIDIDVSFKYSAPETSMPLVPQDGCAVDSKLTAGTSIPLMSLFTQTQECNVADSACDNTMCGVKSTVFTTNIELGSLAPVLILRIDRQRQYDAKEDIVDLTPVDLPMGEKNKGVAFEPQQHRKYSLQSVIVYASRHYFAACRTTSANTWIQHNDEMQSAIDISRFLEQYSKNVCFAMYVLDILFD